MIIVKINQKHNQKHGVHEMGWYAKINTTLYANGEAVVVNRFNMDTYTGGAAYLGKDVLGSVRSATDDYGALEDRYEYDAFGKPYKGDFGNGIGLGYTGKPYDAATGLYNYGYRDYAPEAARFTTVDPVRDGANWFAYVNNDPVNWVDPWGLSASDNSKNSNNGKGANIPNGNRDFNGSINGKHFEAHIYHVGRGSIDKVDSVVNAYPMSVDMQTTVVTVDKNGKETTTEVYPEPIYEDNTPIGLGTSTVYNIPEGQNLVGAYTNFTVTDNDDGSSVSGIVVYK
jgi:RHS repeat-associated protein